MSGTHFPYFGTNYPSALISLDEFVRQKYSEVARMNERWADIERSHRRVAEPGHGRFFTDEPGSSTARSLTGASTLLPDTWRASGSRGASAAGVSTRPQSAGPHAQAHVGPLPGLVSATAAIPGRPRRSISRGRSKEDDGVARKQRILLESHALASVGHSTNRLGARPATAPSAPPELMVDNQRDSLELDGRRFGDAADLIAVLRATPNITILSLRRCRIVDAAMRAVPRLCPHVSHLDLSDATGFTAEALVLTLAALTKLAGLRINNCDHVFTMPTSQAEVLPEAAMSTLRSHLYPTHSDGNDRLSRGVQAAMLEVASLPPPPPIRGTIEEVDAESPRKGESPARSASASSPTASPRVPRRVDSARTASPDVAEDVDEDDLEVVSVLHSRPPPRRPVSAVSRRPRSAVQHATRIMEDVHAGVALEDSAAHTLGSASRRPTSALTSARSRRPMSAFVRAATLHEPPVEAVPAPARGAVAPRPSPTAAPAPVAPVTIAAAGADVYAAGSSISDLSAVAVGKLVCHAIGSTPHHMMELSFSRCSSLTDAMFICVSGQSAGLMGVSVAQSSVEVFHPEDVPQSDGATSAAAASWAVRMTEAETRQAAAEAAKQAQLEEVRRRMGMSAGDEPSASHAVESAPSDGTILSPELGVVTETAARRGSMEGASRILAMYKPPVCDIPLTLQVLDLTACFKLTDHSLAFIGANCPSLAILRLRLCDQPGISDAGIAAVASGCTELITLDLRGCAQLTPASVTAVARHCPSLQRLCLAGCTAMDDAALGVLAGSRCSSTLVDLDITRCKAVSAAAIRNMLFKCSSLARPPSDGVLSLTLCSNIAATELDVLMKTFTNARIVCGLLMETDATKPALCRRSRRRRRRRHSQIRGCLQCMPWALPRGRRRRRGGRSKKNCVRLHCSLRTETHRPSVDGLLYSQCSAAGDHPHPAACSKN